MVSYLQVSPQLSTPTTFTAASASASAFGVEMIVKLIFLVCIFLLRSDIVDVWVMLLILINNLSWILLAFNNTTILKKKLFLLSRRRRCLEVVVLVIT